MIDLFLSSPYISVVALSFFVDRTLSSTIFFLVLSILVVVSGLYLDFRHFAHASKDGMLDGILYIMHVVLSILGILLLFVFQYTRKLDSSK